MHPSPSSQHKAAVHADKLAYAPHTSTHVSYPIHREDAGHIIAASLSTEHN